MWGQGHGCGDGACPQEAHSLIEGKKTIDKVDLFSDGLDIQEGRDLKGLSPQERLYRGLGFGMGWIRFDTGYGGVHLLLRRPSQPHITHEGKTAKALRAVPGM